MTKPDVPFNTYGCPLDFPTQAHYDKYAFAWRTPVHLGAPPRHELFRMWADVLVPGWFEWHDWTMSVVKTLCDNRWSALAGCAGCVRGDTRILNPVTGDRPTIKQLCDEKKAPLVLTIHGAAQAEVPFLKGNAAIFEVRLSNGGRFYATKEHRVLTTQGYEEVSDLTPKRRLVSGGLSETKVLSVTKASDGEPFYDISVPGPEHYFAEGVFHHNSAKTRNVAGFACAWWMAAPADSSVIFCSTTMKMLRKRGWSEVQNFFSTVAKRHGEFGNFVDSKTIWQYKQSDDKHAIFAIAVQEGDINKVAANIQGVHTKRQLVVIDEATAVPAAIWKACANLYSVPVDMGGEFTLVALANPRIRLDQFGRFIEPENGWDSVSVDTDEWYSKPQLDGNPAHVVRFNFKKSPNVIEGRTVSKYLPSKARVEARLRNLAKIGAENDPDHWCYDLGFPPPEGLLKTVFTESMLQKFDGYARHTFTGERFQIIGAFDQAFGGGDRPVLRFGALGEIAPGVMGLEWLKPITLFIDAGSKEPARYQLMYQVRKQCSDIDYRGQKRTCDPINLAVDCTGDAGLADIIQNEWSPNIIRILFSGAASEDPCSQADPRLAKEVYKNKRSEMHFRARNALMSGQLKGIDPETAAEACQVEYMEKAYIVLMDKKEFKLKFGKSPDLVDSGVMLLEVARMRGFRIVEQGYVAQRSRDFEVLAQKAASIQDEEDRYLPQDEPDPEDLMYAIPPEDLY